MTTVSPPSSTNLFNPNGEKCQYLQEYVWRRKAQLTEHTHRNLIALICFNSLAVIRTILFNALVIFVVATRRRLRSNSNVLLLGQESLQHRAILYTRKGTQRMPFLASLCLSKSPLPDQHRSLYCNKGCLEVPGNCHKTADKKGCTCGLDYCSGFNNSGNGAGYNRHWSKILLSLLEFDKCNSLSYWLGLHFWYLLLLYAYFVRNTATEKTPEKWIVVPRRS